MTTRQERRLSRAEAVCHLVMRDQTCGLETRPYTPDVVFALRFMQSEAEKQENLEPGSIHWLGSLADSIKGAIFEWMESVGIDPKSYEKQATQRMAMELAKDALGAEYEGEPRQIGDAERYAPWVEKTADERASSLSLEFHSGKIRSHEELRIAMAAEILEAEQVAREPFLKYARSIFQACEDGVSKEGEDAMKEGTVNLLAEAGRWMNLKYRDKPESSEAVSA